MMGGLPMFRRIARPLAEREGVKFDERQDVETRLSFFETGRNSTQQLLVALEHRLREAKSVNIAVAWALSCSALELLDEAASSLRKLSENCVTSLSSGFGDASTF